MRNRIVRDDRLLRAPHNKEISPLTIKFIAALTPITAYMVVELVSESRIEESKVFII